MAANKDEDGESSENKNTEVNQRQSTQSVSEWETFSEEPTTHNITAIEGPGKTDHNISSEKYLETLEAKLKKIKGKDSSQLTSKHLLQGLHEAKESQLNRMMAVESIQFITTEAYIVDEAQTQRTGYCNDIYRHAFPQQPINKEETECLIQQEPE
ncbi:uncharacterized protein LOC116619592 [Nematostella vectensis]|uniref:uncharacterized protein LOC116619592 n=1 Tax=Nematostella vectensis TaxID=45351 RepID=UPI0013902B01|nr:uncharacterized protein LOC116619592 [Nematostella vectensis]